MASVRMLKDYMTGETYFQEALTGRNFRRITGGLTWPCGDRPGCLVVLGETRSLQNVLGGRHDIYCLAEDRHMDVSGLVDAMIRMTEGWMVRMWATPMTDRRVYLLDDANDAQRKMRRSPLRFGDPQGWRGQGEGLIPFYHALAQRRTKGEKTLFFGDTSSAADDLGKIRVDDMTKKITDWPALAALCFALAEADINPMPEWGERMGVMNHGPADGLGGY